MNKLLLEQIVKHVMSNLGVVPSSFVDDKKTQSLIDKNYLLKDKVSFEGTNGNVYKNSIWGCQFLQDNLNFKILLANCSEDKNIPEFCLIVQPFDAPAYGLYYIYTDLVNNSNASVHDVGTFSSTPL